MKKQDVNLASTPIAVKLKGTFPVIRRCAACNTVFEEDEMFEEADWTCNDNDDLQILLQNELDDLIYEFQTKYNKVRLTDDEIVG